MEIFLWPLSKLPQQSCLLSPGSFGCYSKSLDLVHHSPPELRLISHGKFHVKNTTFFSHSVDSCRLRPVYTLNSDHLNPTNEETVESESGRKSEQWDSVTAKFVGAANIPFLLLQLPQIILNTRNLLEGNKAALLAVPWLSMLTGMLGNLSLLSYFMKKKETEAVVVQAIGLISRYVVLLQLAITEAMPLSHFVAISTAVASGLILNVLKYFDLLVPEIWDVWEEFITIGGLSVLPQVMWSTFIPYVPNTVLPGAISCFSAVLAVIMARMGKLPEKGVKFLGLLSGWTATLLFMWMGVAQICTNILNPQNIKGLSPATMLLAIIANGLLIPRALFMRDLMWFIGTSWCCVLYGWGNLVCIYCLNCISIEIFLTATLALFAWIGHTFWRDAKAYKLTSPFISFKELVFGP